MRLELGLQVVFRSQAQTPGFTGQIRALTPTRQIPSVKGREGKFIYYTAQEAPGRGEVAFQPIFHACFRFK
jgi:hypothetical protein